MTTLAVSGPMSVDQIEVLVLEALLSRGWHLAVGEAIASKTFISVDVTKDANAFFSAGDCYNHAISFSYFSEGRNVTEASSGLIPVGSIEDAVRSITASAIDHAERSIRQSYGVRIAKLLGNTPSASD